MSESASQSSTPQSGVMQQGFPPEAAETLLALVRQG
ncbi:hypothetical protein PCPL58_2929 [Pseudomonas cerasi]|nr:hypothetical protein PCPL58_2929 [Pseudomonas cerasi]SOS21106.1 hypothetical protein PL963_03010 [Pseudomonas cerasi]